MRFELWNPAQRRALAILLILAGLALAIRLALYRSEIPSPQPESGPLAHTLQTKLDINRATWEQLAAIPTLGEKRARAIVAHREKKFGENPARAPFARPADLDPIEGIGPATIELIARYVTFTPLSPSPAGRGPG